MSNVIITPNMNLPVPVTGSEPGPQYATDVNSCLNILDSHNHSAGSGVQITPSGLNINSDLSFIANNATLLRSTRFLSQSAPLSGASDVGCSYVAGGELYYNDLNGNQVQITLNGSVNGSTGTITGLPSGTASASYQSTSGTFLFQSATNKPANIDGASLTLRNFTVSSKGLTLSPPSAMGNDYTVTLPTLPVQTNILTMDTSGGMAANVNVDNSTIVLSANTLQVPAQGITSNEIKNGTIVSGDIADGTIQSVKMAIRSLNVSSSCGSYSNATTSYTQVTNFSLAITTTGNPVLITLIPDGTTGPFNGSSIGATGSSSDMAIQISIRRGGSDICNFVLASESGFTHASNFAFSPSSITHYDPVAAGTYTYEVWAAVIIGTGALVSNCKMLVREIL